MHSSNYKAKWTALNGLTNYIGNHLGDKYRGKVRQRYNQELRLIVKYAKATFPDKNLKGIPFRVADRIAKHIQRDFEPFRKWVDALKPEEHFTSGIHWDHKNNFNN